MGVPKQLRNQVKLNKEIEANIRKELEDTGQEDKTQSDIDTLLAEVTTEEEKKPDNVTELHPQPEEPKPDRTDWKQKYATLQGKYDAEVPRFQQDLDNAKQQIQELKEQLKTQPEPQAEPPRTTFTPEEIADYGEDLLDVMGRQARSIVETEYQPKIDALIGQVTELKSKLGETRQTVNKVETNEVFAFLDREVADWRKTNVDPAFHEWLDNVDPYSGKTRKNLMIEAFDRKNAQQVKAFFDGFVKENAAIVADPTGLTPSGQGGTESSSTLNLDNYVAPGAGRSGGAADAPRNKRIWKASEISSFYTNVQKGKYKNRPEDKARIEADIVSATREGRVQG